MKLKIGPCGLTAARPAVVETRREEEGLFKRRRMEELPVQLWRKKSPATLTSAKVIFLFWDAVVYLTHRLLLLSLKTNPRWNWYTPDWLHLPVWRSLPASDPPNHRSCLLRLQDQGSDCCLQKGHQSCVRSWLWSWSCWGEWQKGFPRWKLWLYGRVKIS